MANGFVGNSHILHKIYTGQVVTAEIQHIMINGFTEDSFLWKQIFTRRLLGILLEGYKMNAFFSKLLLLIMSTVFVLSCVSVAQTAPEEVKSFSFEIPEPWASHVRDVAARIKYPELPESSLYRLGITVDESILSKPVMATRKVSMFTHSTCKDNSWIGGQSAFNADYLVNNAKSLTLAKRLAFYLKSKKNLVKGQLDVSIVNAPSAQAAFDYLLSQAVISSLPPEAIAGEFSEAAQVNDLGTLAYGRGGVVRFVRDNIAVIIRGDGEFSWEALEIARKIDDKLLQQPLLTYEQLKARCPKLHIQPGGKIPETDIPLLECSVEAPAGVRAVVRDLKINGKGRGIQDHKIILEEKPKTVYIKATVVSEELLVSTYEAEIEIPE